MNGHHLCARVDSVALIGDLVPAELQVGPPPVAHVPELGPFGGGAAGGGDGDGSG